MSFKLASAQGTAVGMVKERSLAAGSAFNQGSLMVVNGSGEYAECGADPASIAAVAATACGTDSTGFNILGKKEFPAGKMQGINLETNRLFRCKYVGTLPGADGANYGVIKDGDGDWKTDFADVTATRLKLIGRLTNSPENLPEVIVEFLAANIQPN
jgi:hypothetical protein